jgi:hypothetical protein
MPGAAHAVTILPFLNFVADGHHITNNLVSRDDWEGVAHEAGLDDGIGMAYLG